MTGHKTKKRIKHIIFLIVLLLVALVYIYPVYLMYMNSFKPFGEIVKDAIALPSHAELENYTYVINKIDYFRLFGNNVLITVTGIAGIVVFSSAAAYMLDRRRSKYTKLAHFLIITPMLIPFQTIMITLLKAMNVIHLSGSRLGLGVQYWGFGIPMATFIFYNFMKTIPRELDEAQRLTGHPRHARSYRSFSLCSSP